MSLSLELAAAHTSKYERHVAAEYEVSTTVGNLSADINNQMLPPHGHLAAAAAAAAFVLRGASGRRCQHHLQHHTLGAVVSKNLCTTATLKLAM